MRGDDEGGDCLGGVGMTTLGMKFTRKTHAPAYGTPDGNRRKIAVGLDHDDMVRLSKEAERRGISFSELVRQICASWRP